MILPRELYNGTPPEPRTRIANNPTLLYSWWCTIFAVVIIGTRVTGRFVRTERLFREDIIMAWSIVPLLARMGCIHVVLIWGTNNVETSNLTDPVKVYHREVGARLVLAARIFYAMFIWMAKLTVSEFLKRLTERFWKKGYEWGLRGIRIFLAITFIMVVIATLAECHPFTHYWQVKPDPGPQCRQGFAQLLTMGICDIVTDILLVAFPVPIIFRSAMPLKRKISLSALFSLSISLIIITGARVPLVIEKKGLQQFRTVFASSEILAAAVVSNAIILGSFLRDRGLKKQKFKAPSTTDSMERRGSARRITNQNCSSDENLARSLGYRTKPELSEKSKNVPRPAPVADLQLLGSTGQSDPFANNSWRFPAQELGILQSRGNGESKIEDLRDPMPSPRGGRRVSWVDAGGLLDNSTSCLSPTDSVLAHDFATQPRRGSRPSNTLLPNGRAFPPTTRRPSRLSQNSGDHDMPHWSNQQLHDPGGLLAESREQEEEQLPKSSKSRTPETLPTIQNSSTKTNPDIPPSPTSVRRTPTRASYDAPSLHDAGGLLSSSRPHTSLCSA